MGESTTADFEQVALPASEVPVMEGTPIGLIGDLVGEGGLSERFNGAASGIRNLAGKHPLIAVGMALLGGGFIWKVAQDPGGFAGNLLKIGGVSIGLIIGANVITRWSKGESFGDAIRNTFKEVGGLVNTAKGADAPDQDAETGEADMPGVSEDVETDTEIDAEAEPGAPANVNEDQTTAPDTPSTETGPVETLDTPPVSEPSPPPGMNGPS
jgi:hypothetical protein